MSFFAPLMFWRGEEQPELTREDYLLESRAWKVGVLKTLLQELVGDRPYFLSPAPSFLQSEPVDLYHPVRVDLILPDPPAIFIDVLGPEDRPSWDVAQKYLPRPEWEHRQRRLAEKVETLARYRCLYFPIRDDQPTDAASLRAAFRKQLGPYL